MSGSLAPRIVKPSPFERARALHLLVSDEALASERLGRLTDKVANAMLEANLFCILIPESAGGLGGTRLDLFEACEEVARADGSAGWCLSLGNSVNYALYRGLGPEGRADVFGRGPVASWTALGPNGTMTATAGGYRVSGKWAYGSGSSFSSWVLVTSASRDAEGQLHYRAYVVPKEDVALIDGSWDVLGLTATSSVDYAISDAFVPAHRTFEFGSEGYSATGPIPAMEITRVNQMGLTAFASGVGQRALQELIAAAPNTRRVGAEGTQAEDHVVQFGVGELDGRMRAARSHYVGLISRLEDMLAAAAVVSPAFRLEVLQAAQILTRASRDMAVFAFDHSGTSVIYATNPIQRCFRDLFTGLKHDGFAPSMLGRVGRARLGLDPGRSPF